jgi:hypothetical protein
MGIRKKVNETVVASEAWASAAEKVYQYGPTAVGVLGVSGLGTWFATGWNALSGQGWGIYPLVGVAVALAISIAFAAVSFGIKQLRPRFTHGEGLLSSAETAAGSKKKYVEFWLPTTWKVGPGFKLATLPPDEVTGIRDQAEEIHMHVRVTERMQNVQFEMRAARRTSDDWQTVAKISSEKLVGTVHKDMKQSFLVMRRTFRGVDVQYDDPFRNEKLAARVRAEKEVQIFPENPGALRAKLGEQYLFSITIYHDEGPERASFMIDLHPTLDVPQTRITHLANIEPLATRK